MTGYRKFKSTTNRNIKERLRVKEKKERLKGCESLCSHIGIDVATRKQILRHGYGINLVNEFVGEILSETTGFQILTWMHYLTYVANSTVIQFALLLSQRTLCIQSDT